MDYKNEDYQSVLTKENILKWRHAKVEGILWQQGLKWVIKWGGQKLSKFMWRHLWRVLECRIQWVQIKHILRDCNEKFPKSYVANLKTQVFVFLTNGPTYFQLLHVSNARLLPKAVACTATTAASRRRTCPTDSQKSGPRTWTSSSAKTTMLKGTRLTLLWCSFLFFLYVKAYRYCILS